MNRFTHGFLLVVIIFFGSCNDVLDVEPKSSLPEDSFYQTAKDARFATNAAYAPLQLMGMYGKYYAKIVGGASDDILVNNTGGLYFNSWSFSSNSSILDETWQVLYEGVFRSNLVLQKVQDIDMEKTLKNRLLGEARFLRALYYWHLSTLWGDVPLIKEADPNDLSKAEKAKSPKSEIYVEIIKDLKKASSVLPKRSEYSANNTGRATKGAAQALLGKIYLYDENFSMAESYLDSVITSGEYKLVDDYTRIWNDDNNPEQIFEVQFADVGGGRPSEDFAGANESSWRWSDNFPKGHGGWENLMPRQDHVDEYENYSGSSAINGKDPRLFYNVYTQGDPFAAGQKYQEEWSVTGYTMKKGMTGGAGQSHPETTVNAPILRLGGVILMAAEAANSNNNPSKAIRYLNRIRNRPSVAMPEYPTSKYPVSNKQEILEAIVHERRVELAFEFQRLHDLRRWGMAKKELGPLGYEVPKNRYFPIPQSELDNNSKLEQNPNY